MNEYKKEEIRNIHYNNKNEIQFEYGGQVHHYRMENLKEVFINCWNLQQENIKLKNWKELHSGLILAKENIRLHEQNKKYKEVIDKAINNSQYWIDYYTRLNSDERIALRLQENIDILKGGNDEKSNNISS